MPTNKRGSGNFISEWFGHRLYPRVVSDADSLRDQKQRVCPFLSQATGTRKECIKPESAKGVCTISSSSNGSRQDWVVCPYRTFDRDLMLPVVARMYDSPPEDVQLHAAPTLQSESVRADLVENARAGKRVLVYFDLKMGGEIQVAATEASPQISFDTTFVELVYDGENFAFGKFAVVEVQTMDFHGSYRNAVRNLEDSLRLHNAGFPEAVESNPRWLAEKVQSPNIANVFKRTFWQLMFKFEMAFTPSCAGVALVVPSSVWDSWQKFLAVPPLHREDASTWRLSEPSTPPDRQRLPSWIYVFDFDYEVAKTPSPLVINKVIRTSAAALAHYAVEEAPRGAIAQLQTGIYPILRRRLQDFWRLDVRFPGGVSTGAAGTVAISQDHLGVRLNELLEPERES